MHQLKVNSGQLCDKHSYFKTVESKADVRADIIEKWEGFFESFVNSHHLCEFQS